MAQQLDEAEKLSRLLRPSRGAGLLTTKTRPRRGRSPGKYQKHLVGKDSPKIPRLPDKGGRETTSMSELIAWRPNWPEAQEEAKKANLPLALEFFMDG